MKKVYCKDCENFGKNPNFSFFLNFLFLILMLVLSIKIKLVFGIILSGILFIVNLIMGLGSECKLNKIKKTVSYNPVEKVIDEEVLHYFDLNKNNNCKYYGAKK